MLSFCHWIRQFISKSIFKGKKKHSIAQKSVCLTYTNPWTRESQHPIKLDTVAAPAYNCSIWEVKDRHQGHPLLYKKKRQKKKKRTDMVASTWNPSTQKSMRQEDCWVWGWSRLQPQNVNNGIFIQKLLKNCTPIVVTSSSDVLQIMKK